MEAIEKARALRCWYGPVDPQPLAGGITNTNFVVTDNSGKFVVRIGDDIPEHGIMRFNELATSRAAFAAGISPEVVHAEPGALVLRFIDGKTFGPEDVRKPENLQRIIPLIRKVHDELPNHFRGAALVFWVFHVLRDYTQTLKEADSRMLGQLDSLSEMAAILEKAVGPVEVVFGHNDLLAANFIDDGARLWLIDWDYAGYNSPLFDLGGLASNNEFSPEQERWLLEAYYGAPADDGLLRRYEAMKCASLLRETMWSMVSEVHSTIDFDYIAYTDENLARFRRAYETFSG
ncbi:MAG: phosphotransferase [Rhodospirillaceae bacterium]|nr:phosphotransferase [Rhodospirillaceae bacterium]